MMFHVYQCQYTTYYINCWFRFELNIFGPKPGCALPFKLRSLPSCNVFKMVVQAGIEPATLTLSRFCSTTELLYRKLELHQNH